MKISSDLGKLLSGSSAAQLISAASIPILSRLYSPSAFGEVGSILAMVSITSVVIHGRYHNAIPTVHRGGTAKLLLILALALSGVLSIPVSAIFFFIFNDSPNDFSFIWKILLVALLSFSSAVIDIFSYWRSRISQFSKTAQLSMARSIFTVGSQIAIFPVGSSGLILGLVFGTLATTAISAKGNFAELLFLWKRISFFTLGPVARKFSAFPLFGMPQGLVAAISWNALPMLLLRFGDSAFAGQYWIAYRLLVAPLSLFNGAYRQARLPKLRSIETSPAREFIRTDTLKIFQLCLGPLLLLFIFGETIFSLVLGENWILAGEIAGWMAIGIFGDVLKIPTTCLLQSVGLQRRLLVWELSIVLFRYLIIFPFLIFGSLINAIVAFSLMGFIGWLTFVIIELLAPHYRDSKE